MRRRGVSLVELLAAMAMIFAVAAAFTPSFLTVIGEMPHVQRAMSAHTQVVPMRARSG